MLQTAFAAPHNSFAGSGFFGTILGSFFALAFVAFLFVSILLWYHWVKYGMGDPFVPFMQILYFLGALILLASALFILL